MTEIVQKELSEYKKFALGQNMAQVAIGLVLATAFQKAVTAISSYLIMPVINYFLGYAGGDWRDWKVHPLKGMEIEMGHLVGSLVDFAIMSLVLFLVWYHLIRKICPPEEKKDKDKIAAEVIYLKRDTSGNWKTL